MYEYIPERVLCFLYLKINYDLLYHTPSVEQQKFDINYRKNKTINN